MPINNTGTQKKMPKKLHWYDPHTQKNIDTENKKVIEKTNRQSKNDKDTVFVQRKTCSRFGTGTMKKMLKKSLTHREKEAMALLQKKKGPGIQRNGCLRNGTKRNKHLPQEEPTHVDKYAHIEFAKMVWAKFTRFKEILRRHYRELLKKNIQRFQNKIISNKQFLTNLRFTMVELERPNGYFKRFKNVS